MYVSQRGLVIPKKLVSPEEIESMKRDLTLIPKKNHVMPVEEKPIAAFRENEQKLYVPRFYGIDRYAVESCPHEIEDRIPEGDPIHVPFVRELRDYQKHIVGVYFDHVKDGSGGAILEVPCGRGKCLGLNTPILMYDGTIKMVQDVCVSDVLMGDDSTPRNVLSLARGRETMYKVCSLEDDESYIANESHILSLQLRDFTGNKNKKTQTVDISISQFLKLPEKIRKSFYGYRVAIDFNGVQSIPEDPYKMGQFIGNNRNGDEQYQRIPHIYKINSRQVRLNLLAGIVESNCCCLKANRYIITYDNSEFIDDVIFVARSLGISAKRFLTEQNISGCSLYGTPISSVPVENSPNIALYRKKVVDNLHYRFTITQSGEDVYYGFETDGNR